MEIQLEPWLSVWVHEINKCCTETNTSGALRLAFDLLLLQWLYCHCYYYYHYDYHVHCSDHTDC